MADLSPQLWRTAKITDIITESPRTKTFRLEPDGPYEFIAGQHFSIQLHTIDGYVAARDFSFSSAPSSGQIDATIVRLPHGEVSGWFHESAKIGDSVEISPALGHYFNWTSAQTEPILLIGGGVGIAPLISIFREHRLQHATSPISLLYSVRNFDEVCFKSELVDSQYATFTYTGHAPSDWHGHTSRINTAMLEALLWPDQTIYVCGPTAFVEAVNAILIDQLSVGSDKVRNERFG